MGVDTGGIVRKNTVNRLTGAQVRSDMIITAQYSACRRIGVGLCLIVALSVATAPAAHAQKLEIRNKSKILLGRTQLVDSATLSAKPAKSASTASGWILRGPGCPT